MALADIFRTGPLFQPRATLLSGALNLPAAAGLPGLPASGGMVREVEQARFDIVDRLKRNGNKTNNQSLALPQLFGNAKSTNSLLI